MGLYSFRLLDFAAAVPLTIGTTVNDTLDPRSETHMYRFIGTAGDSLRFESQSVGFPNNAWWRLLDPYNNTLFLRQVPSDVDISLSVGGTHTLLIEGRGFDAGSLPHQFSVQSLGNTPPPTISGLPLTLGTNISGSIDVAGEQDTYAFNLPNHVRLHFDALSGSANMQWTLTGPTGSIVSPRSFRSSDSFDNSIPVMNVPPGDYVLTVSAATNSTGSYAFRLLELGSAATLTPGTQVTGTLNPGSQTHLYRWAAQADDRFYFDVLEGFSNATWRLVDPYSNVLFSRAFTSDEETLTISQDGTYTILIEGRWTASGSAPYRFIVHRVVDDLPDSDIVEVDPNDGTVVNRFSTPGPVTDRASVAFDGTQLYFANGTNTLWTVDAETGAASAINYPNDLIGLTTLAGRAYLNQANQHIARVDPGIGNHTGYDQSWNRESVDSRWVVVFERTGRLTDGGSRRFYTIRS